MINSPSPPSPAASLPHARQFMQTIGRKRRGYVWATLVLSVLAGASFVALRIDSLVVPFLLLLIIALPILLWRLPRLSLYGTLGAASLIEITASNAPDAFTDRIPLFININTLFQVYTRIDFKALPINLFELFIVTAGICSLFRSVFSGTARIKGGDLWKPIAVYMVFVVIAWVNGMASGGDFKISLQEVRGQFYFFLAYLMAVNVVQGRKEANTALWISVVCIAIKGAFYTFRRYVTLAGQPLPDQGVGSHEEAFLFDNFVLMLCALLVCGSRRKMQWFMIAALPVVLLGNLATNRRAGTAALVLMIPVLFLCAYAGLPKRRPLIVLIAAILGVLGMAYYQVGKNSGATWAQPARAINSQFEPNERDLSSNLYRDAENYNQMATIKANPLGYGYGKPFLHIAPMEDISDTYIYWDILPHNQVLWVWMRTGFFGFYAFWMMITIIAVYACRFIRDDALDLDTKALAMFVLLSVGSLLVFGLLDLQLSNFRDLIFVGVWVGILTRLKHFPPLPPEPPKAEVAETASLVPAVQNGEIIRRVRRSTPKRRLWG